MSKPYSRIYVEITNICNRNCSFCPGTSRPQRSLSLDEFSFILDSLNGLTDYIYFHVMGEPLTHPLLPEFVLLASSYGFKPAITTNGTLLPTRGEALLSAPLYKLNISLHSFE
jgi:MoaA/NifB/PqqE/SkfB family radical SAM enzyme